MKCLKKLFDNIIYYCWDKPLTFYYDLKWFFSNCRRFRKQLWNYRTWDSCYNFELLADSFEWLAKTIENGNEERKSANKKIVAIKELVGLLRQLGADNDFGIYNEFFEKGKESHWTEQYNKEYDKRRKKVLNRIHRIIKGQDEKDFKKVINSDYDQWVEIFDGTGYEGWWE